MSKINLPSNISPQGRESGQVSFSLMVHQIVFESGLPASKTAKVIHSGRAILKAGEP
jgi:hypothetical protein